MCWQEKGIDLPEKGESESKPEAKKKQIMSAECQLCRHDFKYQRKVKYNIGFIAITNCFLSYQMVFRIKRQAVFQLEDELTIN